LTSLAIVLLNGVNWAQLLGDLSLCCFIDYPVLHCLCTDRPKHRNFLIFPAELLAVVGIALFNQKIGEEGKPSGDSAREPL